MYRWHHIDGYWHMYSFGPYFDKYFQEQSWRFIAKSGVAKLRAKAPIYVIPDIPLMFSANWERKRGVAGTILMTIYEQASGV